MSDEIGGAADRRDCPVCGKEIMAAATTCGYCWTKLAPVPAGSAGTRVGRPLAMTEYEPVDEALRKDCPACGRRIMALATTCGYCWTKLTPVHNIHRDRKLAGYQPQAGEAGLP